MSGRSGYGRSKIVGKLINLPANMMMAGLAPKVGKPGWAIRLYYARVDECFCVCDACILKHQTVILPPVIIPPTLPPTDPTVPPTLPPPLLPPPGPILPPSKPGFPTSSAQLPQRNGFPYPGTEEGEMRPFATLGGYPSEAFDGTTDCILDGSDDNLLKSGGHYIMAQFNREISVLGGGIWGQVDISYNNFGPYVHGSSANMAADKDFLALNYKKIAENSPVYKVGFGGATANTTGAAAPGTYNATNVYIAQNVPFAAEGTAPYGYGSTPTMPFGMQPYQWLLLDIEDALESIRQWDNISTDFSGVPSVAQGQWSPDELGRKAADDYARNNSVPAIVYDPRLAPEGPNIYDEKVGLLYAEACGIGIGAIGPLAPFSSPATSLLTG